MLDISANEVWFVTGSQHLYGPDTLRIVADHAAAIAAGLDGAAAIPVKVVVKPVLTGPDTAISAAPSLPNCPTGWRKPGSGTGATPTAAPPKSM